MSPEFQFDVFLSHSTKDKPIVRELAERLRSDGLRVWFDEWQIQPGDSIPAKIEHGLEHSRVLVLAMSAGAFGSDWAQLESQTFRFRDPLNRDRRFIPLRLDDAPVKGSLAQFFYIDWRNREDVQYSRLADACIAENVDEKSPTTLLQSGRVILVHSNGIYCIALMPNGNLVADTVRARLKTCRADGIPLDSAGNGTVGRKPGTESMRPRTLAVTSDGRFAVACAHNSAVEVWDINARKCVRRMKRHDRRVCSVALSQDDRFVVSGSYDGTVCFWDFNSGKLLHRIGLGRASVKAVAFLGATTAVCASGPGIHFCEMLRGDGLQTVPFSSGITSIALSQDRKHLVLGTEEKAVLLLYIARPSGSRIRLNSVAVFEGHTGRIQSVDITPDGKRIASGSFDKTVRVWDVESGACLETFKGHGGSVRSVCISEDGTRVFSASIDGTVRSWDITSPKPPLPEAKYTNAKVLLVGDSGVGKTGLALALVGERWQPSDSTVGAWATQWKLPVSPGENVEQEIWLWDFGGQADQRLIHQLYMDETALAVLVFDGQKEDLFETLGQWDRDLARASRKRFAKLLVAGRVDAGGLRCSPAKLEAFAKERGYAPLLETSAKTGTGCDDLKEAILKCIHWEDIPWRTSPRVFKRLKAGIIRLKDEGRVLMRFNELRDSLRLRMVGEDERFSDEELKAVIGLLGGPGAVWELKFGSWVLLQPEWVNAYAQAVIQTLREDRFERGCIPEERVLAGDFSYQSSLERLPEDEERIVLLAMHQMLVERALCLREHTEAGTLLIFPSYYRRERKELAGHPAVLVSYRFNGFLDEVYATLVVRLHHNKTIENDQLWRYAADFKTLTGKQLGVKLTRLGEGTGELDVYFDPAIPIGEKIVFSKFVHEHVMRQGQDVVRLRHYVCPHCGTEAGNRDVAMKRLNDWLDGDRGGDTPTMLCVNCEQRFPLWDEMEQYFASSEAQQRVRDLQERSEIILDNESKERALVGEVISTVALAGQICRELTVSDHGIDMEIEFKNDAGEATGAKLYLQLKSGDSYLREGKRKGAEIFTIKKPRHADYWRKQAFPVLLVIRTSDGEVRWMEIRDLLQRASEYGQKPVRQIEFKGERLDVMSVRRWRDRVLQRKASE